MSAGRSSRNMYAVSAISPRVRWRSGVPTTPTPPSRNSRSSSDTSSFSAAMRLIFSFTSAAAPATAPETMTVNRDPPGPVPGSACCESAYVTTTDAGSTSNSSATTWATTVSGLFPHSACEWSVTTIWPIGSTWRLALSGLAVGVNSGLSNQNQNSVEEKTLRSLEATTPMPTWRPSARSRSRSATQWSYSASSRIFSSTAW